MDNKDSERYFVGSDGHAYIVSSQRYASFHVDSHHFQKLCDGGWKNTTVRLEIIAYLARSYVEVSDWEFDRTCGDSMADAARRVSAAEIRKKFDTIERLSREAEHVAEILDRIGWPAVRTTEREAFVDLTKRIEAWKKGWNW